MKKRIMALVFVLALGGLGWGAASFGGSVVAKEADLSGLDLAQSLEAYKQAAISRNIDQVMAFIYPGMFTQMPREQVRAGIVEMYKTGKAPQIKQMMFQKPGAPQVYGKGLFVVIRYHVEMEMPRPGDATPEIDKFVIKMMKQQLGEGVDVTIDEKNSLIKVARDSDLIAVNEGNQGWKMIEKDNLSWLIDAKALPEDLAALLQR